MKGPILAALTLSALALVLVVLVLFRSPDVPPPTGLDELSSLRSTVQEMSARIDALGKKIGELDAHLKEVSACDPGPATADLERLLDERMQAMILRTEGYVDLRPDQLPEAVVDSALKLVPGMEVVRTGLARNDDRTLYSLGGRFEGEEYNLVLTSGGTVITARIPIAFVPTIVAETASGILKGSEIINAELATREDKEDLRLYSITCEFGDDEYEMLITTDGKLLEAHIPPERAPQAVVASALATVEGLEISSVCQEMAEDEMLFGVEGRVGRDHYEVWMSPGGEVWGVDMPTARLPQVVREAALKAVAGMRLGNQCHRSTEDGETLYNIEGRARGRECEIIVSATGEIVDVEGMGEGDDEADLDGEALPPPDGAGEIDRF